MCSFSSHDVPEHQSEALDTNTNLPYQVSAHSWTLPLVLNSLVSLVTEQLFMFSRVLFILDRFIGRTKRKKTFWPRVCASLRVLPLPGCPFFCSMRGALGPPGYGGGGSLDILAGRTGAQGIWLDVKLRPRLLVTIQEKHQIKQSWFGVKEGARHNLATRS